MVLRVTLQIFQLIFDEYAKVRFDTIEISSIIIIFNSNDFCLGAARYLSFTLGIDFLKLSVGIVNAE